ncbi:MAG: repair protein RadC [Oscillospiraceae bacterium]|nr:repair protein RadC [Oscillospiraceae bacterium]
MPDHKALELLLFYARPQGDVNPLAHALIDHFGSFSGVLNATPEQLMAVPGLGEHSAVLIKLVTAIGARYLEDKSRIGDLIDSSSRIRELFAPYFFGSRYERAYVACLDGKRKLLSCRLLDEGTVDSANVSIRKMMEIAMACNASYMILAHNHVSGIAWPSTADILTTRQVHEAFKRVGIGLVDHVIFCDDDMVSMRDSHMMVDLT